MSQNVDQTEIDKFSQMAHKWWDLDGEFKPLHQINPLRTDYIDRHAPLDAARVVDVGCGGGILTEALARRGATVTGVDLAKKSLKVAQLHALDQGLTIDYRCVAVEALAAEQPASFDRVVCMEMLEHVPDPQSVVSSCAALARPGGWVFFSTLNRNLKSYLMAVVGAEYVLNWLPRGTHDYARFIKPSELTRMARNAGLELADISGMRYNPLTRTYHLDNETSVNYLMACRKPG
ncbi:MULTISPECIES: bifunctional 2-polyprenyl-6-hydroxyphenol methylase/3-demethylubiquinol 3-O-methyltransferase UbiG [Microvirgula]|uniref:Ubiquinone biosynthesis O-methyltransferase n=1 Tax=Microvirgula aerodenitrificans TaxID=57480 RepID=A0A2S0P722_9NEIS|nr:MULTISPECIES: bifunctional 2-polyprenyl-6-hydroxyphenol methylase/3-demethylubiquinol 3-O-methyltransferase UbiG [Microvirgula]AVY93087.1 bifunctional 2-polyprenyl-6-hydroxyphenol methylase/3-demethylubiquinol 3-O-methyltransferase UbiG [Microvirgula aerodenitrificans]RAS11927.1 3-demethylubiquinone-9 3-methyltransferase [Microvirgula sp. AG722]